MQGRDEMRRKESEVKGGAPNTPAEEEADKPEKDGMRGTPAARRIGEGNRAEDRRGKEVPALRTDPACTRAVRTASVFPSFMASFTLERLSIRFFCLKKPPLSSVAAASPSVQGARVSLVPVGTPTDEEIVLEHEPRGAIQLVSSGLSASVEQSEVGQTVFLQMLSLHLLEPDLPGEDPNREILRTVPPQKLSVFDSFCAPVMAPDQKGGRPQSDNTSRARSVSVPADRGVVLDQYANSLVMSERRQQTEQEENCEACISVLYCSASKPPASLAPLHQSSLARSSDSTEESASFGSLQSRLSSELKEKDHQPHLPAQRHNFLQETTEEEGQLQRSGSRESSGKSVGVGNPEQEQTQAPDRTYLSSDVAEADQARVQLRVAVRSCVHLTFRPDALSSLVCFLKQPTASVEREKGSVHSLAAPPSPSEAQKESERCCEDDTRLATKSSEGGSPKLGSSVPVQEDVRSDIPKGREQGSSEGGGKTDPSHSVQDPTPVDDVCFSQPEDRLRGFRPPPASPSQRALFQAVERELNPLDFSVSLELERVKMISVSALTQQHFAISNFDGASVSLNLRRYSTECNVALKNLTLSFISERREARLRRRRRTRGTSLLQRRRIPFVQHRGVPQQLVGEKQDLRSLAGTGKEKQEGDERPQNNEQHAEPVAPYREVVEPMDRETEGCQPQQEAPGGHRLFQPVVEERGSPGEGETADGERQSSSRGGFERRSTRTDTSHFGTRTVATKIIGILPDQPYVLRVNMRSVHPLLPSFLGYALELGVDIGAIELVYLHRKFWKLFDWILDSFIGTLTASPSAAHPRPPSAASSCDASSPGSLSSSPVPVSASGHPALSAAFNSSRGQFFPNVGLYRVHRILNILSEVSQAPPPSRPLVPPAPFHVPVQEMVADANLGRPNVLRCSCGVQGHSAAANAYLAKVRAMRGLAQPPLHLYSYNVTIRSPLVFVPGAVSPVVSGSVGEGLEAEKTRGADARECKAQHEGHQGGEPWHGRKAGGSVTEGAESNTYLSKDEARASSSPLVAQHVARCSSVLDDGTKGRLRPSGGDERTSSTLSRQEARTTTGTSDVSKQRKEKGTSVEKPLYGLPAFEDTPCPGVELRLGDFSVTNRIACEPGRCGLVEEVMVRLMQMKGTVRWRRLRTSIAEEGVPEEGRRRAAQGEQNDERSNQAKGGRRRAGEVDSPGNKNVRGSSTIHGDTILSSDEQEENEVVLKEMDVVVRFIRGLNNSRRKGKSGGDAARTKDRLSLSSSEFPELSWPVSCSVGKTRS